MKRGTYLATSLNPLFLKFMFQVSSSKFHESGFTLLEVVMVVAIISVISVAGAGYYVNYAKSIELESAAKNILSDLRNARSKAMAGESDLKWGVHLTNGSDDYYELYSTPTTYADVSMTTSTTTYLSSAVIFTAPPSNSSSDVLFTKIQGTPNASSTISIFSRNATRTIMVTTNGIIY